MENWRNMFSIIAVAFVFIILLVSSLPEYKDGEETAWRGEFIQKQSQHHIFFIENGEKTKDSQ